MQSQRNRWLVLCDILIGKIKSWQPSVFPRKNCKGQKSGPFELVNSKDFSQSGIWLF